MLEVHIATDEGDVAVCEDDLPLSNAGLKELQISRAELERLFALAADLMRSVKPGERARACADQTLDGKWEVRLVRYSELSDPMLDGKPLGKPCGAKSAR